jgi:DNA-dependent protein kinase catalytic subunit
MRIASKHLALLFLPGQKVKDHMEKMNSFIPSTLLRDALIRLSANIESFVYIRDRFIRNYAVVCIASYLLGIGDRHLENFLLNFSTGEVVSIDFGFSFGQGLTQYLPELMPFRLTHVFEGLSKPVGLNGMFRHTMIHALTCFRKKR